MRKRVLILIGIAAVGLAGVCGAMRVDGVRVFGRTQDVSVADIRHALADFLEDIQRTKPAAIEVISHREMRAHLQNRDLGWLSMELRPLGSNPRKLHWSVGNCCGIQDPPVALHLIRAAERLYIFPIKNSLEPCRDDKHMRLLEGEARRHLVRLLSKRANWHEGHYHLSVPEPEPDIGIVFRGNRNEVVLFFCGPLVRGTVDGKNTEGLLDFKRQQEFEQWKRRFAQQELPSTK